MTDDRTAVYHHIDADGVIQYIGCSAAPAERFRQHLSSSPWAKQVVRIDIEWFDTRKDALAVELARIKSVRPPMNRQLKQYGKRNNWSGNDGHRYVKAWADKFGLDASAVAKSFFVSKAYAVRLMSEPCHPRMQAIARFCVASDGYVPDYCWGVRPGGYKPVGEAEAVEELAKINERLAGWKAIRAERDAA
jgi:hypothetical protein